MARTASLMKVDRRKLLAGVAATGAAIAVSPPRRAAATAMTEPARRSTAVSPPSAQVAAAETGTPKELPHTAVADGSDFMVDVI